MAKRFQIPDQLKDRVTRPAFLLTLFTFFCACQAAAQSDTAPSFARNARIGNLVFTVGEPIAAVTLPQASGGNIDPGINDGELSDYSFDPARLPTGLEFDRFTRVLSGTPTATLQRRTFHLWVHDDDENWAVGDGDSLRFTIEVISNQTQDASVLDGAATLPREFSASFETEFQWFHRDRLPAFSSVTEWRATAWRGESLHKQILVAGTGSSDGLSITASEFRTQTGAVIPSGAVSLQYPQFVIGDVEARGCAEYEYRDDVAYLADALANEPPGRLPRSYPSMIWISIDVPPDSEPGEYGGSVTIRSRSGDETTLQIDLDVLPWQVPPLSEGRFHLDLWQFPVSILERYRDAHPGRPIAPWSEEHFALLEPFYRYLAKLGQRTVTTYIKEGAQGAPSMIRWAAVGNGQQWRFDYSAFDSYVERLAKWGIDAQISAFSPVGWNTDQIPFLDETSGEEKVFNAPIGSDIYNALWNHFLTDFKAHLLEKGWFEKTVLYMDEVPQEQMEAAIALIRYNDENWKIGLAYGHAPDDRIVRSLYDVSGYFESELDVQTYDHQLTTFYTSCSLTRPNNYVAANAHPADMTAMAWYALARGHDGHLRWAFDNWKALDPLDLRDGAHTAGDYSFVYRSSNDADMTVIPSVRSELLRDGIEDYEKIIVLQDAMRRCGRPGLLIELQESIALFSTDALLAGGAVDLLADARAALDGLSKHPVLVDCR